LTEALVVFGPPCVAIECAGVGASAAQLHQLLAWQCAVRCCVHSLLQMCKCECAGHVPHWWQSSYVLIGVANRVPSPVLVGTQGWLLCMAAGRCWQLFAVQKALGAQLVHLVQVVLNWYNLVAALAAGGVPFCDQQRSLTVGSHLGRQCHSCCERTCPRVTIPPPPKKIMIFAASTVPLALPLALVLEGSH
jgi:hypothetical protein